MALYLADRFPITFGGVQANKIQRLLFSRLEFEEGAE